MAGPPIITPPPANGGTGSAQAGAGRAPDYRQLQAPEEGVPSWALSRDAEGIGREAQELGNVFREFEGITGGIAKKSELQAGALAGAAVGATGHPQYKAGIERFTAYGEAFNNAATGAYAVEAEAQADDAAARLRVNANNDPAHFATTYAAVRDGVLKEAPAQAQPILKEIYDKRLGEGVAALAAAQAAEQQQVHRNTWVQGIQRQTSRVAALSALDDPKSHAQAADELTKLTLLVHGGVNAGLYSPAEAESLYIGAMRAVTSQVFTTQLDNLLANGGDAIGYMQRFMDAHQANLRSTKQPALLSDQEAQKLIRDGMTQIYEHNAAVAFGKKQGATQQELRFQNGEKDYTVKLFAGQLTDKELGAAVASGNLKPSVARTLGSSLRHPLGPTDRRALFEAYADPQNLDWTPSDILALPGINDTDKLKLMEHIQKQRDGWDGTQQSRHARQSITAALKIPPGTPMAALSDSQRDALIRAQAEYTTEMGAADPAQRVGLAGTIAQKVIGQVHQQEAQEDIRTWSTGKQTFISMYGPHSAAPMDSDRYEARLKYYDQQISQAQSAAKVH